MRIFMIPAALAVSLAPIAAPTRAMADMPASTLQDPQVRAAMTAPGIREGVEAMRRSDGAAAARYLRGPASRGNPMAQIILGRMYADGKAGVPRDYKLALRWLVPVIKKDREPFKSMAMDGFNDVIAYLHRSPDEKERTLAMYLAMARIGAMLPPGARSGRAAGGGPSLAGEMMQHNLIENGDPLEFGGE